MKKRSRLEITLKVLHIIYSGTCKTTHIMNEAGISWVHFKEVLSALERQGFVQSGEPKLDGRRRDKRINKVYTVTEKGVNVLQYFRNAKEFELVDLAIPF